MIELNKSDIEILNDLLNQKTVINVMPTDIIKHLPADFSIDSSILNKICSSLNSGSHIMLSGSPGTGKTTLAMAIVKAATNREAIFTTATSDWTTFDTIGGYLPDINEPGKLTFEPGIIYQSISDRRWIIVDEINRAPIDKAIGPLFSVLSDNDVSLAYKNTKGERLRIVSGNEYNTDNTIYKVDYWRMITTLNEFDKMSLYEMSYAFLRRFAIIHVPVPKDYLTLINGWFTGFNTIVIETVKAIADSVMKSEIREIGPAVFKSMSIYMENRKNIDSDDLAHLVEATELYILAQFQGADEQELQKLLNIYLGKLSSRADLIDDLKNQFNSVSGYTMTL